MDIGELLSKYWKYIGRLVSLRLKRSGIEYVILARAFQFLDFALSEAKSGLLSSVVSWRRRAQRAIFSRISTFWHLKTQKIARPQGRPSEDR